MRPWAMVKAMRAARTGGAAVDDANIPRRMRGVPA